MTLTKKGYVDTLIYDRVRNKEEEELQQTIRLVKRSYNIDLELEK